MIFISTICISTILIDDPYFDDACFDDQEDSDRLARGIILEGSHPVMKALENSRDDMLKSVAGAKQNRRKNSAASAAGKNRPPRLQGEELRRALEELRETKSEPRAQELKRAISVSLVEA
jgi:hypothetical protein